MKHTKQKTQKLVTLTEYVQLVRQKSPEGKDVTHQTFHSRKNRGVIKFVIGGSTPEYKIDVNAYPPEKFTKESPGRRKTKK